MVIFQRGSLFTNVVNCINHNAIHTSNLGYPFISGVSNICVRDMIYTDTTHMNAEKI